MACYTPLTAYRAPGGRIVFDSKEGWSDRPLELRCGNCIGCRSDRSRAWALRCIHESLLHEDNSFITLTYSDEHLPEDGGLQVRHWQLFAKRLRKAVGPFRFYHCGEYGPNTNRPHYHACLFGIDWPDRILVQQKKSGNRYYSPTLTSIWGMGSAETSDLTYGSAEYVARYCMKKLNGDQAAEEYGDLRPPYATMSRGGRTGQGGIGATWLKRYRGDVYPADEVIHGGRRFRPPKFYDNQLDPEELDALRKKRLQHMNKEENTHQRRRVRERVHLARIRSKTRTKQL